MGGAEGGNVSDRAVYKTFDVEVLDDFYGDPETFSSNLEWGKELLQGSATRGLSSGFDQYEAEQQPAKRTGTGEFGGWIEAAGGADAERVIRLGYAAAVQLAIDASVPVDTFFVAGASDEFEVHLCEGKRRVTVLMFMPRASEYGSDYGSRRAQARSWIFRTARSDDPDDVRVDDGTVVQIQRSGP